MRFNQKVASMYEKQQDKVTANLARPKKQPPAKSMCPIKKAPGLSTNASWFVSQGFHGIVLINHGLYVAVIPRSFGHSGECWKEDPL
jgi:hypothetical protein